MYSICIISFRFSYIIVAHRPFKLDRLRNGIFDDKAFPRSH